MQHHLMRREDRRGIWLRAVANVTALAGLCGVAATGYIAAVAVQGMSGNDASQAPAHVRDGGNRTAPPPRSRSATNTLTGDEDEATEGSGRPSGLAPARPQKSATIPPTSFNTPSRPNTAVQGGSNGS
jgi:hypothetical protein